MEILTVNNLSFSYGTAPVLSDVSFVINKGDFIALAGPNGAGKTTLIRIILGLEKNQNGIIKIFGDNLGTKNNWNKIGYLPQRVNIFNPLFPATVEEVVSLGLLSQKKYPKKINKSDEEKIDKVLELLEIANLKKRPVNELSGGQQQRIFLARALVSNPELLIMDEPSTALDPEMRETFFKIIEKLNKENGVTVVIITHDTAQMGEYANRLLYLDKSVIFCGPFADFCHSGDMEKYFGHFAHHLICHQH